MSVFDDLDAMISGHKAWSNSFFDSIRDGAPIADLRLICPEYYHFTSAFPAILSHLVARVEQGTQFHLVSILYSELGSGAESKTHANLFRNLCRDIGVAESELAKPPRLPTTKALIDGLDGLYETAPLLESLGAQYALECQADNMLRSFRRAFAALDGPTGHRSAEGMEFFEIHERDEPDHIHAMRQALIRHMHGEDEMPAIFAGATRCLDLFAGFWHGLSLIQPSRRAPAA